MGKALEEEGMRQRRRVLVEDLMDPSARWAPPLDRGGMGMENSLLAPMAGTGTP